MLLAEAIGCQVKSMCQVLNLSRIYIYNRRIKGNPESPFSKYKKLKLIEVEFVRFLKGKL